MNIINICLWLYIFFKPFYLSGSGSLQISDGFIILAFVLTFMSKEEKRMIDKKTIYIFIFSCCVTIINLIYYSIYQNTGFVQSIMYYVFILMGIMLLNTKVKDESFLNVAYYTFIVDIVVQLILYIVGVGKNWMGTTRYMGTLRDPNQFAFFIFLCMMYIHILEKILQKKKRLIVYFIGVYLIFLSASTGMLLAVATFVVLSIISNSDYMLKVKRVITSKQAIIILFIILIGLFILGLDKDNWDKTVEFIDKNIVNSSIVKRTMSKFEKSNGTNSSLAEDRNLDMLYNNWEYIFIGAGEGAYDRFNSGGEIHSTLPSMLFYYGIIPLFIVLVWIYKNLKGLKIRDLIPYIAIFIESFTLLNQRQLLLWGIIMLAPSIKQSNINRESDIFGKRGKTDEENFNSSSSVQ
ncbi:MAG: hypothetical protein J6J36_05770 [Clostridia bacterium]|nr:hypothetical protein [Clostridia bacterium]